MQIDVTPRQMQVIRALARGKTQARIAQELGVSTDAIKQHTRLLRVKLNVERAREIPYAARMKGLLDD